MARQLAMVLLIGLATLAMAGCGASPLDLAATAFAPTEAAAPGTPIRGTATLAVTPEALLSNVLLRQGEEHRYTFVAQAGQAVTVRMEALPGGSLDSYLELYGPDGTLLVANDDGGSGVDSQLDNVVLPRDGEYTVVAVGFNRASTGSYSLQMSIGTPIPSPTPTPTPEPGGGPIGIGQLRSGAINSAGQVDLWRLEARAGDIVTARMETTGPGSRLDPFLEVIGPDGAPLASDDDGGTGLNARILNLSLPVGGLYTFQASGQDGSTGNYNLSVSAGATPTPTRLPPTPGPSPTPVQHVITPGEPLISSVRPSIGGDMYRLQVDAPLVIELLLEAADPAHNLYLELYEPIGGRQVLVEYSRAVPVIYLPSLFLRVPGEYRFRVLAVENDLVTFSLLVNRVEAGASVGGQLAYGQGLSGALTFAGQEDVWTFEGQRGDVVTVIMKGVSLDSYLQLLAPDGSTVATNDDAPGSGSLDARIVRVPLPQDGTYTIVASSFRSGSYGSYRILLFRE